jgi:membrane protein CcdC involved in cytochrome C biogenesis
MVIRLNYSKKPVVRKRKVVLKSVGTILLIAVGVLAIGLALKLVGDVDFLSVVGLGLSIVLISVAFERVKLKYPAQKQ